MQAVSNRQGQPVYRWGLWRLCRHAVHAQAAEFVSDDRVDGGLVEVEILSSPVSDKHS